MEDEGTVYKYRPRRNKPQDGSLTPGTIKKKLIAKNGKKCNQCNNIVDEWHLHLDHIKPLCIGGEPFEESNMQLLCDKCHKHKTYREKAVINALKVLGVVKKPEFYGDYWTSVMSKDALEEEFYSFSELYDKAKIQRETGQKWFN